MKDVAIEIIDKISKMLAHHDLFDPDSFQCIQCLARKGIVEVRNLVDDLQSSLVVRCIEQLENLIE